MQLRFLILYTLIQLRLSTSATWLLVFFSFFIHLVCNCLVFFFAHAVEVSDFVHVDLAKVVSFSYMATGFFFFFIHLVCSCLQLVCEFFFCS
jgi:hypothetical protein